VPVRLRPLIVAAALSGCGGGADAPRPSSGPQATAAPDEAFVNLAPSRSTVDLGRSERLSGAVDDHRAKVVLHAEPFPYGSPRALRRLRPNDAGRFSTRVRPRRSTRYWVRRAGDPAIRSETIRIEVVLIPRFRLVATGPTSGEGVLTWKADEPLRPRPGARACLYREAPGRDRWRRVSCSAVRRGERGRLEARLPYAGVPEGERLTFCARTNVARGFRQDRLERCGAQRLDDLETDALR